MLRAADKVLPAFADAEIQRWGLFVRCCSRAPGRYLALVAVPNLRINKPQQRVIAGVNRECRMQQQSTCSATLADRSISVGLCAPPAKEQFAGILNDDDLSTGSTIRRARSRMARHLGDTYPFVAQKARELNFPRSVTSKTSNTRTGPSNQRLVKQRPPFSRRRSPNRPSPISSRIDSPP